MCSLPLCVPMGVDSQGMVGYYTITLFGEGRDSCRAENGAAPFTQAEACGYINFEGRRDGAGPSKKDRFTAKAVSFPHEASLRWLRALRRQSLVCEGAALAADALVLHCAHRMEP